jgi:hypothetical protein
VHFGFGVIDKGEMTHSGAGYVTGANNVWYAASNTTDPTNGVNLFNKPRFASAPFGTFSAIYVPNALPAGYGTVACNNTSSALTSYLRNSLILQDNPANFPVSGSGGLLDHVIASATAGWSGTVPLYGIPLVIRNIARSRHCAIGMFPDVRFLNMDGLLPGAEITLAEDTWKVFPIMRQEAWASSNTRFVATTGQYAVAYKKVA